MVVIGGPILVTAGIGSLANGASFTLDREQRIPLGNGYSMQNNDLHPNATYGIWVTLG